MVYRQLAEELVNSLAFQRMPPEQSGQISRGERGILSYLSFGRNGALAGEISRDLGLSTGRTAIALKNLEKKGLIVRAYAEHDRRCVVVRVTDAGRAAAQSFRREAITAIEGMLVQLGERDAREYVRIMKRILAMNAEQEQ